MKKLLALSLCLACVFSMTACGKGQKAQQLYYLMGSMSFSDESILTNEELSKLQTMREQREQYLKDKDLDALSSLKEEWSSFRQPIESYINQYQAVCDRFFDESDKKLLTDEELKACRTMEASISEAYKARDNDALSQKIVEWDNYSKNLREVIDTYNDIDMTPFDGSADKDLLSSATLAKMADLSAETEDAFANRDAATLKSLKSRWYSYTNDAKSEIEEAKEKMLNNWVLSANVTNSLTSLFSLGTISSSTSVSGHQITYTTQYNYDVDSSEIKKALDSYLSWTSSVFESGVSSLKTYIDDVCIRIEYKDKNGNVISYRDFK